MRHALTTAISEPLVNAAIEMTTTTHNKKEVVVVWAGMRSLPCAHIFCEALSFSSPALATLEKTVYYEAENYFFSRYFALSSNSACLDLSGSPVRGNDHPAGCHQAFY
jgi:hypothetical protein